MLKIKLTVGLAALMTTLVVLTAPAMATFQSNTGQSQGPIVGFPETTTFESTEGGPAVSCKAKNAEGKLVAKGGWIIQSKTLIKQGKYTYQEPALKGPHEQFKFESWGVCTGPTGLPVTVECSVQIEQVSQTLTTGSVQAPGCVVKIGSGTNTCTINVAQAGNQELPEVKLANEGVNATAIESEIKGTTSTVQESVSLCKTLGIKGSQGGGKFFTKVGALKPEGQKVA